MNISFIIPILTLLTFVTGQHDDVELPDYYAVNINDYGYKVFSRVGDCRAYQSGEWRPENFVSRRQQVENSKLQADTYLEIWIVRLITGII